MNKNVYKGAFLGGIIAMLLFGIMEYLWAMGGLAPVLYCIGLAFVGIISDLMEDKNG